MYCIIELPENIIKGKDKVFGDTIKGKKEEYHIQKEEGQNNLYIPLKITDNIVNIEISKELHLKIEYYFGKRKIIFYLNQIDHFVISLRYYLKKGQKGVNWSLDQATPYALRIRREGFDRVGFKIERQSENLSDQICFDQRYSETELLIALRPLSFEEIHKKWMIFFDDFSDKLFEFEVNYLRIMEEVIKKEIENREKEQKTKLSLLL